MDEENKIVIVSDNGNHIDFDDVTVRHDSVDRNDVAEIEAEIANLEQQRADIDDKLVALKQKIAYAKRVIEIADAQAAAVESAVETPAGDGENPNTEIEEA